MSGDRIQALKDADEAARRAFHTALCDGDDYSGAIAKGSKVYLALFAEIAARPA